MTGARQPVAALVLAALVTLAGCGVGSQDRPELLAAENVPDNLLDPDPPTTTIPAVPTDPSRTIVQVYYLLTDRDGETRLAGLGREIAADQQGVLEERLKLLLEQSPTADEREAGFSTSIPADTVVNGDSTSTSGDLAVIDLSPEFFDNEGPNQRAAFAQVVCTTTDIPGVSRVRFNIDGESRDALNGDGNAQRTVTCDDYPALQPLR